MKWFSVSIFLACCACAGGPREGSERATAAAGGASRWYAAARAAHSAADVADDPAATSGALERLASLAASDPPAEMSAQDAIALRQDLYGRAIQLALDLQQIPRASELLHQAIVLPSQPGPFHRQLTILAGRTYAAAGDQPAADRAYRQAASE
jgi:hypothetical protein